jgi:rfaE bifunctional protein kinase chain/domain
MIRLDFEQNPSAEWICFRAETFEKLLSSHQTIVFSDYAKGALIDCENLIATACRLGAKVLVDPKGYDFSRYHGGYLLSPNAAEFRTVVGPWKDESQFTTLAQKCRSGLELQALLVTRGEEGMTLFDSEGRLHIPSEAREVFDVSGAGDTVVATIALMLAEGKSLRESVAIANKAAGIVVGKLGTATVSREELFGHLSC